MKSYSSEQIRNIVLLGHGGVGKTTISEAMAHVVGLTKKQGNVVEKNTISDFDIEEQKRGFSINTTIVPIEWDNHKINIIDTPGYFDFVGDVKQAVRIADGAIIVVSGKDGTQVGTEKAWEYTNEREMPRMIFVNGMDNDDADLGKVLEQLKTKFGKGIAPFQVPIKENGHYVGFVNIIKMKGRRFVKDHVEECEIPDNIKEDVARAREMIVEAVAETSEELMGKYFNEEPFTLEEMQKALHGGIADRSIVPVLCGTAIYNTGIQVLINSIIKYLSSTKEFLPSLEVKDSNEKLVEMRCSENEPVSALVFKTIADPYIGKISMFKVYSGIIKASSSLVNASNGEVERLSHLYIMRGKEQIDVSELRAGDIGVVTKLTHTQTGDTLCGKSRVAKLPPIVFPESLMAMSIKAKEKADEDKVAQGLHKLMEEDLTIKLEIDKEINQELIYGIGEQHLDIILSKLKSKFKVDIELEEPIVSYRETIKSKITVQGKHKKQSGGHGQFGDVRIEFEPLEDHTIPFVFKEKIVGGSVPKNYFPAVEKGLHEFVKRGTLAGYPVVGLKATLIDGSYHPVDSSEMAFKMATIKACKDAFAKANPVLLEPIASLKILIPQEYMGDIIGDLNKRRGRISGMNPMKGKQEIIAEAPMSELFSYPTDLRSITQGRGEFTMKFERYEEAPMDIQQKVINSAKEEQ